MKEKEFRKWLAEGSANTEKGRNTRVHAIKTIERQLGVMKFEWIDLDQAWDNDGFDQLRDRLSAMRKDAKAGGQDYRILMPESDNPLGRLSSWRSWLSQYGRFLAGEVPSQASDADRIRLHVLETYIEPSREKSERNVDVLVRDVNTALGLNDGWPNICQALTGKKFLEMADVPAPVRIGADQSPATVFQFNLRGMNIDRDTLEQMRTAFMQECPDFYSFTNPGEGWPVRERDYKLVAAAKVQSAVQEDMDEMELGRTIFDILKNAAKDGPFVRWQTEDTIRKASEELLHKFYTAIGALARFKGSIGPALSQAFSTFEQLKALGASSLTFGERINIIYSTIGMARPHEAAPLKISAINSSWKLLTGSRLFVEPRFNPASDYAVFAAGFGEIFAVMKDEWKWHPNDWLDVQGFLWIAMNGEAEFNNMVDENENAETQVVRMPINLILYGPPGTGKTYATAAEAIRLCGVKVPEDRGATMSVYSQLCAEKRIEFVTFHQSMSYEDFIEGRQPVTDNDGEDSAGTGFRLETVPGIFRRISKRAATSRGQAHGAGRITTEGRQVFKMSMGYIHDPEQAHLFEEAIEGGFSVLGYEDIDWSDAKFADRGEIVERLRQEGLSEDKLSSSSGHVQMPYIFRNWVNKGDIVVVPKGNSQFRAIGEFTGEYEFHPRPEGGYAHRRTVRWLWIDREGAPVEEIYSKNFMMKSIYALTASELKTAAQERYMNSQDVEGPADPEPFVLIIDEINRANMSKVFGELITLIEPDKRLGMQNELRVRLPYSGEDFGVPSNLHILGTMNTADRSIALLDTALRRRFEFREMMPDPDVLQETAKASGIDLPSLLRTINERIEYLYDREHQIGHAYFMSCTSKEDVDAVMRHKVIPLLSEYFFEDWSKVAAVLGDAATHEGMIDGGFLNRAVLKAPPGLDTDDGGTTGFRWTVRSKGLGFDYAGLLGP